MNCHDQELQPKELKAPRKILLLAGIFFLLGALLLAQPYLHKRKVQLRGAQPGEHALISNVDARSYGTAAIVMALAITWFYLHMRNELERDAES